VTNDIWLGLAGLSLMIWLVLLGGWGRFWRADQWIDADDEQRGNRNNVEARQTRDQGATPKAAIGQYPTVWAVVPARNEAEVLPRSLASLLAQNYPGNFAVVLVDDQSTDGSGDIARQVAQGIHRTEQLQVISGKPLAAGWTGKLWAMEQGICWAQQQVEPPDYFLFTDADIEHSVHNLSQLTAKAEAENLDLTSLMVLLRCESPWEKLLIPAFVFFFQLLYPFAWVNDPARKTAAAAGGCILIRRQALERIGGLQSLKQALIDDCSLAAAVKNNSAPATAPRPYAPTPHPIWLGLTTTTRSLRPYPTLKSIWDMVARTAYTQLHYSPLLLIGTVSGMGLVYLLPPVGLIWGITTHHWPVMVTTGLTWLLMALAYWPTLRIYRGSPLLAFCLPMIGLLYTLMTMDSALQYWRGQGGSWKGRTYDRQSG
jgi:hopene-associated glycosyltransferase HpnB